MSKEKELKEFLPEKSKMSIGNVVHDIKKVNFKKGLDSLEIESGVYVFVLNKDLDLDYCRFMSEVTGVYFKNNCPYTVISSVPKINLDFLEEDEERTKHYTLKANRILYVGRAKNLKNRIEEHLNNDNINKTSSLKLGFNSRKDIKDAIDLWVIKEDNNKGRGRLESKIRNEYGCYFGQ